MTKNTGFVLGSGILNKVFSFFFIAYAARVLGPHDFGLYALIGTFTFLVSFFGNLGIEPVAIREIAKDRTKANELFNDVLSLRVGMVVLVYPLIVLVLNLLGYSDDLKYLIYISGFTAIFHTFSASFGILYIAFERFKIPSLISILVSFLSTVAHILVLYLGYGLKGIVWVLFAGSLFGALISGIWIRRKIIKYKFAFNLSRFKDLISQSVPFAILAFFQQLSNTHLNILLLSKLPGPLPGGVAIGYYNPASSVCRIALMFSDSFRLAALPTVSSNAENLKVIRGIITKSTESLLVLIIFPLVLATSFFPKEIIHLIFGTAYMISAPVLTILGWAYALNVFNTPVTLTLSVSREIKRFIPWLMLLFCINLILAVPLIIYYGFFGAAIAFLVTKILETLVRSHLLKTIWGIKRLDMEPSLVKAFMPMVIIISVIFLARLSSVNTVGLLVLTSTLYLSYVFSLKSFRRGTIALISSLKERGSN